MPESRFRFTDPPVRSVRLAYFFTSERPLLTVHASAIYQSWRQEYPLVRELAPRAPIDGEAQEVAMLADPDHWPMPFVEFESAESRTRVFFQADRFGLSWNFGDDDSAVEYPGFEKLRGELNTRFDDFRRAVLDGDVGDLVITGAECAYKNEILDHPFDEYVTGLLTGWSRATEAVGAAIDGNSSFDRHYHYQGNEDLPVWVQAVSGDNDGLQLRITTRNQDVAETSASDALQVAHDILIEAFALSTSQEMRDAWGPE